ncbi:MAG: hypothetical protein RBQ94_02635 [Methanimicrococcus sp.]|nr:hypothetical protein [Methanimicrococcus sp.]
MRHSCVNNSFDAGIYVCESLQTVFNKYYQQILSTNIINKYYLFPYIQAHAVYAHAVYAHAVYAHAVYAMPFTLMPFTLMLFTLMLFTPMPFTPMPFALIRLLSIPLTFIIY